MQSNPEDTKQLDDSLNLSQQPHIMSQLRQKEQIRYSTLIQKINEQRMCQERIFLLTNQAIYNIAKKSGLIKSLVSRLISLQSKYSIKRRIPLKCIYGITLSKSKQNGQFLIHVINDYDYRYCTQNHEKKVALLKKICQIYTNYTGKKLAFYFRDQIVLIDYLTRKGDHKNKVDRKPKQDPVFLSSQDFQEYQLPDLNYQLQYPMDSQDPLENSCSAINMKNFRPIFQIQKLQSNNKCYTVTTGSLSLKATLQLLKFKSKYLLQPEFIFSTKNKIQLITPFMIGGNLSRKLQTCVRISNQLGYFYIAQLIIMLEQFDQLQIFYGNFCLENIFINENGYLRIMGVDRDVRILPKNKILYDIVGSLPYIAPQMIGLKGYDSNVNLWRLGICAYRLLIGCFPYEGTCKRVYFQILNKKLQAQKPQILQGLLQKDPSKRMSLEELKNNLAFSDIDWQKLKQQKISAPYQPDTSGWKGNIPSIVQLRPIN